MHFHNYFKQKITLLFQLKKQVTQVTQWWKKSLLSPHGNQMLHNPIFHNQNLTAQDFVKLMTPRSSWPSSLLQFRVIISPLPYTTINIPLQYTSTTNKCL